MPTPRLAFQPLADLLASMGYASVGTMGRALGLSRSSVRWYRSKGVTPWQADRLAIALGRDAWTIWPDWEAAVDLAAGVGDDQ